jgi:hypothetical protein
MKDSDGLFERIKEFVTEEVTPIEGLDFIERDMHIEEWKLELQKFCMRWLKYGEYVKLEFDTEAKTCTVLPVGR